MHLNYELDIVKVLDSAFLGHRYDSPLLKTLSFHARIGGGRHRTYAPPQSLADSIARCPKFPDDCMQTACKWSGNCSVMHLMGHFGVTMCNKQMQL